MRYDNYITVSGTRSPIPNQNSNPWVGIDDTKAKLWDSYEAGNTSNSPIWGKTFKDALGNPNRGGTPYVAAEGAYKDATSNLQNTLNRLQSLLLDPSQVQQTAGYKFALDQGNQAINRSAAAKGMLNSGNVLAELAKYGQGMASNEFQNQVNNLGSLANQYSGQAGQAGQFLASANSGQYQVAGLNPDAPSYYSRQGWW